MPPQLLHNVIRKREQTPMVVRYPVRILLLLCCAWTAVPAWAAGPPRLRPESFTLQTETLSPKERQDIYLRLIENSVGWAEHTGKFVESDEQEPGGGYFEAKGAGVTWARGNGNLCLAYALLLEELPERQRFSIYQIPRQRLEDHLRRGLRTLCLANRNASRHKPTKHTWGGPSWQSALEAIGAAWAAHLREKHLDADTLALVREVVSKEADHLEKEIPSGKEGNTRSEDCTWNTPLLAFAANKYADHPHAARWDELCKKWAINAMSTKDDAGSTKVIDGRPLKEWIVSENVYPDLTIENHNMWSVGYQCASQSFGEGALAYRVFGRPVPEAYAHHADRMWRDVTSALFLWDGDILFPQGQDWSWKVYSTIEYLCWLNCLRQNQAAGAFESRALQMIYRRQLAIGTGDLGAAFSRRLNFGNQTTKPKRWCFSYLMHKYFTEPESIGFEEAEKGSHGVHVYPFTRTAIHRTPKKCVSVSWHHRFQPIYILPEGDTTFTDPPFFFPYDRESGCARVKVKAGQGNQAKAKRAAPVLEEAAQTHQGGGMRIRYRNPWPGGVTQYTTVCSLPDEATVYCTVFRARRDAKVTVERLFPLRATAPPGFEKPVRQYRGPRWLNMSDHVGFVSVDPLPRSIPEDRFFLTEKQTFRVKRGEWFGRAVLVVFARQPHQETARLARQVGLLEDSQPGRMKVSLESSSGATVLDVDFARGEEE